MRHRLLPLGLLGLAGLALAGQWSDFDEAFPGLPCNDGWSACLVGGTPVTPGMVLDRKGHPHAADMRVGFFEFDPLPGFSPFAGLSEYTGKEEQEVAQATPPPRAAAADRPAQPSAGAEPRAASTRRERDTADAGEPIRPSTREPVAVASNDQAIDPGLSRTTPTPVPANSPPEDDYGMGTARITVEPDTPARQPVTRTPEPAPAARVAEPEPAPVARVAEPEPVVAAAEPAPATRAPTTTAAEPQDCDDLVALEAPAMMGQLGVGRRKCLEGALAGTAQQTRKNKISRVLIADAQARGDKADWERLMKRHLEEIDRSDPNLCYTYAIRLSQGGVGRANGVIRWADYALENKQLWSGATYKKNVYGLLKLRAQAANKLWQDAEQKYVEERNDENEAKALRYRGMAKDYSREWLDYARASEQDVKAPLALCVSAAGNKEFCDG